MPGSPTPSRASSGLGGHTAIAEAAGGPAAAKEEETGKTAGASQNKDNQQICLNFNLTFF